MNLRVSEMTLEIEWHLRERELQNQYQLHQAMAAADGQTTIAVRASVRQRVAQRLLEPFRGRRAADVVPTPVALALGDGPDRPIIRLSDARETRRTA